VLLKTRVRFRISWLAQLRDFFAVDVVGVRDLVVAVLDLVFAVLNDASSLSRVARIFKPEVESLLLGWLVEVLPVELVLVVVVSGVHHSKAIVPLFRRRRLLRFDLPDSPYFQLSVGLVELVLKWRQLFNLLDKFLLELLVVG